MLDEVELWGAVTAPRQFFLAQNTCKISLALFGFLGLGHLVDRPAFASYLHHLPNMRPGRPEIHPPYAQPTGQVPRYAAGIVGIL